MIPAIFPVPITPFYLIPIYGAAGMASQLATFGRFAVVPFRLNLIDSLRNGVVEFTNVLISSLVC